MGLPVLQHGEQWLVQSRDVTVREIPFHAYLTNRRVILTSPYDPLLPDKDLNLDRIEGIEGSANDMGEPVLIIGARTSCSGSRRLILTFSEHPGNPKRVGEREDWIQHLALILKNPTTPELPGPVARSPRMSEDQRARYDSGKLVFSPGICESGNISPQKKEVNLIMGNSQKHDLPPRSLSGRPGPSPEMHRPPPPVSRSPDRSRQPPSPPQDAPRMDRPVAPSDDGSFFCTTCGSRVRLGSRYCDRCGAKVIPPDPVLPAPPLYPPPLPVTTNCVPRMVGDSYSQDTVLHPKPGEPDLGEYGAVPPVRFEIATDCVDAQGYPPSPEPVRKKSGLFPAFRKNSPPDESRDTAGLPVTRERGRTSHRSRIAIPLVAAIMILCVTAGVVALVSPGEFSKALSGIVPPWVSTNGTVTPTPTVAGDAAQGSSVKSGEIPVQNAVSSISPLGIFLKIQYSGPWSGSYDMVDSQQAIKGTGEQIFPVENVEDSVTANIKKEDTSSNKLVVELYRDGEMIATGHTSEHGGQVTVSGSI